MSLPDTAEYWDDVKNGHTYMGTYYTHAPNVECGHKHPFEAKLLGDVTCPSCLYHIRKGAITNIPEGKTLTKKEKKHLRYIEEREKLYGRCSCGELRTIRVNKVKDIKFLGCVKYPECKVTSSL